MDTASKDSLEPENKNEEPLNYHSPNMSSQWQLNGTNLANSSLGLIRSSNSIDSTSCSAAPMMVSFCPTIWDQPSSSQNLGFCDISLQQNAGVSQSFGGRSNVLGPLGGGMDRPLDMGWTPPNPVLKGGMFMPTVPGLLPQSIAQIPADSGFIERAARYSCFSAGNFSDMMNPFSIPGPLNPYSSGVAPLQRPQDVAAGNALRSMPGMQTQRNDMNIAANSRDAAVHVDHGPKTRSPQKSEGKSESLARSQDEGKQGTGASELGSDEAEFSGRNGQEEPESAGGECSAKGLGSKKRKRTGQDHEVDENMGGLRTANEETNHNTDVQQKEDHKTTSTATKPGGKNGKQQLPQTSDPAKEEYIHVRARRGQATNSHSLAERVRREKISERMKFLQDLVPGCSKVTGKAVMLDEIINYVQSLQRQVEFLSMKLATVNPRLDFNIESLLAKDILLSRAGPSSSLAFPSELTMQYPALHPLPSGLIQAGLPGMVGSSDALRRSINAQFTNKESSSQVPSSWEDELHNVIQMSLNSVTPSSSSQDLSASLTPGNMKAEM